jgi:chorismate mutase
MSDDERELVGRLFELVDAPFHGALRALLAERDALAAEVAALKAERDEARREILKVLKQMYTTTGLRLELSRRGWWEWYKEVRP